MHNFNRNEQLVTHKILSSSCGHLSNGICVIPAQLEKVLTKQSVFQHLIKNVVTHNPNSSLVFQAAVIYSCMYSREENEEFFQAIC